MQEGGAKDQVYGIRGEWQVLDRCHQEADPRQAQVLGALPRALQLRCGRVGEQQLAVAPDALGETSVEGDPSRPRAHFDRGGACRRLREVDKLARLLYGAGEHLPEVAVEFGPEAGGERTRRGPGQVSPRRQESAAGAGHQNDAATERSPQQDPLALVQAFIRPVHRRAEPAGFEVGDPVTELEGKGEALGHTGGGRRAHHAIRKHLGLSAILLGQGHHEFVAPEPDHQSMGRGILHEGPADHNQGLVAPGMSGQVVEFLQAVQIEKDDGTGLDVALAELALPLVPVEEAAQGVTERPRQTLRLRTRAGFGHQGHDEVPLFGMEEAGSTEGDALAAPLGAGGPAREGVTGGERRIEH